MSSAVTFAAVLFALQIAGFALLTRTVAFPVVVALAALAGFSGRFQFPLPTRQRMRMYGVLILVMALKRVLFPSELIDRTESFVLGYPDANALAQFLILLQVVWLFVPGNPRRTLLAPYLTVVVLYLSANYIGRDSDHQVMLAIATIVTPLYAFYRVEWMTSFSKGALWIRNALLAGFMVLVLVAGVLSSLGLQRHRSDMDRMFAELLFQMSSSDSVGLSDRAMLGNVLAQKTQNRREVLVRVESQQSPGYLRTSAYDLFDGTSWTNAQREDTPLPEAREAQDASGGETVYSLGGALAVDAPIETIYPASGLENRIPVRLETVQLAAPVERLGMDRLRIVRAHAGRPAKYAIAQGTPSPEATPPACLGLPPKLDPGIRALAETVFQGAQTTPEKVAAVVKYFSSYTYQLGITVPPGKDRMAYFLLEHPPAHCEYFASGAALLLRLGGVPCRYVTGLHVNEYNPAGGYWIGRNSDAHAWVEAWDAEAGWTTVEATPGGPNTDESAASVFDQWYDYVKLWLLKRFSEIRAWFAQGLNPGVLLHSLWSAWPVRWGLSLLALACLVYRFRKRLRGVRRDPEFKVWHHLLERMDRQARRRGWTRRANETLHQFALRIETAESPDVWNLNAARWYRDFAAAWYRVTRTTESLIMLEKELSGLQ